jgi:hypothetical protein
MIYYRQDNLLSKFITEMAEEMFRFSDLNINFTTGKSIEYA